MAGWAARDGRRRRPEGDEVCEKGEKGSLGRLRDGVEGRGAVVAMRSFGIDGFVSFITSVFDDGWSRMGRLSDSDLQQAFSARQRGGHLVVGVSDHAVISVTRLFQKGVLGFFRLSCRW